MTSMTFFLVFRSELLKVLRSYVEQPNVPAEEVEEKRKELAEDQEEGGAREGGPWQEIRWFMLLVHLTLTM